MFLECIPGITSIKFKLLVATSIFVFIQGTFIGVNMSMKKIVSSATFINILLIGCLIFQAVAFLQKVTFLQEHSSWSTEERLFRLMKGKIFSWRKVDHVSYFSMTTSGELCFSVRLLFAWFLITCNVLWNLYTQIRLFLNCFHWCCLVIRFKI